MFCLVSFNYPCVHTCPICFSVNMYAHYTHMQVTQVVKGFRYPKAGALSHLMVLGTELRSSECVVCTLNLSNQVKESCYVAQDRLKLQSSLP